MRRNVLLSAMTLANFVLLLILVARNMGDARARDHAQLPVLRGSGLEIVDDSGRVRASIGVMPAGTSAGGVAFPETVLLRLITEKGRPSVKIAATEEKTGLSFAGPTGTKDTYLILEAGTSTTSLRLRNENGHEHKLTPE